MAKKKRSAKTSPGAGGSSRKSGLKAPSKSSRKPIGFGGSKRPGGRPTGAGGTGPKGEARLPIGPAREAAPLSVLSAGEDAARKKLQNVADKIKAVTAGPSNLLDAIHDMQQTLSAAEADLNSPPSLVSFFRAVGEGVVGAQRELDGQSDLYSKSRPEHATSFRIPKVHAEINFQISSVQSKGFNVIVASAKNELEKSQQQKVSFDVVAAPPPPELLSAAARRALVASTILSEVVIVDRAARVALRDRLKGLLTGNEETDGDLQDLIKGFDAVVCLEDPSGTLMLTATEKDFVDAIWLPPDGGNPVFVNLNATWNVDEKIFHTLYQTVLRLSELIGKMQS